MSYLFWASVSFFSLFQFQWFHWLIVSDDDGDDSRNECGRSIRWGSTKERAPYCLYLAHSLSLIRFQCVRRMALWPCIANDAYVKKRFPNTRRHMKLMSSAQSVRKLCEGFFWFSPSVAICMQSDRVRSGDGDGNNTNLAATDARGETREQQK